MALSAGLTWFDIAFNICFGDTRWLVGPLRYACTSSGRCRSRSSGQVMSQVCQLGTGVEEGACAELTVTSSLVFMLMCSWLAGLAGWFADTIGQRWPRPTIYQAPQRGSITHLVRASFFWVNSVKRRGLGGWPTCVWSKDGLAQPKGGGSFTFTMMQTLLSVIWPW